MNILCRLFGHKWDNYHTEIDRKLGIKTNWETCSRCKLGREWINKISKNPKPGELYFSELSKEEREAAKLQRDLSLLNLIWQQRRRR